MVRHRAVGHRPVRTEPHRPLPATMSIAAAHGATTSVTAGIVERASILSGRAARATGKGGRVDRALRNRLVSFAVRDLLRTLHQRMFGRVWKWAGQFRTTARNIGVDAYRIPQEVAPLVGDARYWVELEPCLPDEIAIRFAHRPTLSERARALLAPRRRLARATAEPFQVHLGQRQPRLASRCADALRRGSARYRRA